MNNDRRRRIAKAIEHLTAASSILEEAYEDESEALGNMPESLEDTERYEKMEEAEATLSNAVEDLATMMDELTGIIAK